MSLKRTYISCAKVLPHLRKCKSCNHTCALRMEKFMDFEPPLFTDGHEDKAVTEFTEDQKELAQIGKEEG